MAQAGIIGTKRRYIGDAHPWAQERMVIIRSVHRDGEILETDRDIGELMPGDMIEFSPWIERDRRWSWVTSDAAPEDLAAE